MKRAVNILAAVVALVGLIDSCYLILDHYKLINSKPTLLADVCPLQNGACAIVTESPDSTILGVPYSVLGGAYFAVLLGISLLKLHTGKWPAPRSVITFLAGGLAFSVYLVYIMYYVKGEVCPYCMTAHAANAAFIILFGLSLYEDTVEANNPFTQSSLQH